MKSQDFSIGFLTGRLHHEIELYARSLGLPASDVTRRVAEVLFTSEGGEILGAASLLSDVRSQTGLDRQATVKVAAHPHLNQARRDNGKLRPGRKTDDAEIEEIVRSIRETGSVSESARRLGIPKTSLYSRLYSKNMKVSDILGPRTFNWSKPAAQVQAQPEEAEAEVGQQL